MISKVQSSALRLVLHLPEATSSRCHQAQREYSVILPVGNSDLIYMMRLQLVISVFLSLPVLLSVSPCLSPPLCSSPCLSPPLCSSSCLSPPPCSSLPFHSLHSPISLLSLVVSGSPPSRPSVFASLFNPLHYHSPPLPFSSVSPPLPHLLPSRGSRDSRDSLLSRESSTRDEVTTSSSVDDVFPEDRTAHLSPASSHGQ